MSDSNTYQNRRDFVKKVGKWTLAIPIGYLTGSMLMKSSAQEFVWQIDPHKCTQCGQCETNCVLTVSAVKCMHAYQMCGYCDLCSGYLRQGVKELNTGAELQLCPTSAIKRSFVENPYFAYTIDEELCNACGKCVKGCADFGNGSLFLQIKQDLCVNCNQCSIAQSCPADAIQRVPASTPYLLKDGYKTEQS
ncbi:MAG: ferredoxin [Bacteroidales bacterium]|nr:ferredoxin [Bacteroidales bacterium]